MLTTYPEEKSEWVSMHLAWKNLTDAPGLQFTYFDGTASTTLPATARIVDPQGGFLSAVAQRLRSRDFFDWPERIHDEGALGIEIERFLLYVSDRKHSGWFEALPLFVSSERRAGLRALVELAFETIEASPALSGNFELVCQPAPARAGTTEQDIRLPVVVMCEWPLADEARNSSGFLAETVVRDHMLDIRPWSVAEESRANAEIVVLDERRFFGPPVDLNRRLGKLGPRTRLAIVLEWPSSVPFVPAEDVAGRFAVAVFPDAGLRNEALLLRDFLREFSHDLTLHQIVRELRKGGSWADDEAGGNASSRDWFRRARVYASPESDNALRLTKLVPQVLEKARNLYPLAGGANVSDLIQRISGDVRETRGSEMLASCLQNIEGDARRFSNVLDRNISFDRESNGLRPISDLSVATEALRATVNKFAPEIERLLKENKSLARALEREQRRQVDAALFRYESRARWSSIFASETLREGERLRLEIHIGQRKENSLVAGAGSSLDPLLPPLTGEQPTPLDIVIFPKDFRLLSPAVQRVHLSRFGGTEPVSWELTAPTNGQRSESGGMVPQDTTRGTGFITGDVARLRFNVCYKNQLLQSFEMKAHIGLSPVSRKSRGISIVCDFSQTKRFGQLERLDNPFLSIAINGDSETHTLMLSKDGTPTSVRWTESQMAGYTAAVRDRLYAALTEDGKSRYRFFPNDLSLAPGSSLDHKSIRELADHGAQLKNQLFFASRTARPILAELAASSDKKLQVVLADVRFSVPWALIYDFPRPRDQSSQYAAICTGSDENGKPCDCQTTGARYCMRGFWGLRHIIEQLSNGPPPIDSDAPERIALRPIHPAIGVVRGQTDNFLDVCVDVLTKQFDPPAADFVKAKQLVPLLRDPALRPALVVFVGHNRNALTDGLPDFQLVAFDGSILLRADDIVQELQTSLSGPWAAPRSIVVIGACASGTTRVDTGVALSAALMELGAGGVLATECVLFSPIVARMVRDLAQRLVKGEAMGMAVRAVAWDMIGQGCPAGLAFTFLGRAGTRLP